MVCIFINDTATTEIYTYGHSLSRHDALPIWGAGGRRRHLHRLPGPAAGRTLALGAGPARSPVLAALCLARAAGRHRLGAGLRAGGGGKPADAHLAPRHLRRERALERGRRRRRPRPENGRAHSGSRVGLNVATLVVDVVAQ